MQNVLQGKSFAFLRIVRQSQNIYAGKINGAYILKLHSVSVIPQNFLPEYKCTYNMENFSPTKHSLFKVILAT